MESGQYNVFILTDVIFNFIVAIRRGDDHSVVTVFRGGKKIPLSLIGIIQFISPTLQMINGMIFFNEELSFMRLIGFIIVWIAVGLFIVSEYRRYQTQVRLLKKAS